MATVLVFAEQRDGRLKRSGLEALAAARKLADAPEGGGPGRVVALLVGSAVEGLAGTCAAHGADEVLLAEQADLALYAPQAYRDAVLMAVRESAAAAVLLGATAMGLDLAARAAARLGVGCLTDVVDLSWGEGGDLVGRRPVYAGKAFATARLSSRPAMATLRPNLFPASESPRALSLKRLALTPAAASQKTLRVEKAEGVALDVAEADVVVSGGRGLRAAENFKLVEELARELGGAVGSSRAVVDAGWIGHETQVGQTGKVVSPKLYVACGISGAIQHLAGMSGSKVIVAINKDADAPIFKTATYGAVGDLFEVLPALVQALREHRARRG